MDVFVYVRQHLHLAHLIGCLAITENRPGKLMAIAINRKHTLPLYKDGTGGAYGGAIAGSIGQTPVVGRFISSWTNSKLEITKPQSHLS